MWTTSSVWFFSEPFIQSKVKMTSNMAAKGTGNTDRKNGMTNGLVIVQYLPQLFPSRVKMWSTWDFTGKSHTFSEHRESFVSNYMCWIKSVTSPWQEQEDDFEIRMGLFVAFKREVFWWTSVILRLCCEFKRHLVYSWGDKPCQDFLDIILMIIV